MKTLYRILIMTVLFIGISSCSDDEDIQDASLELTYANLHGTWRLDNWNGQGEEENWYCYITFDRKEHTFVMYQRFGSMVSEKITGSFEIEYDENLECNILAGEYDYGQGEWIQKYIVSELKESTMTWLVKGDDTDISKYVRCDKIPEDILNGTRAIQ